MPTNVRAKSFRLSQVTAEISVISKPRDATISVGKRMLGRTPMTIRLAEAEEVTVTVSKAGYASSDNKVMPGVDQTLSVELKRLAP
jgi:hypothetical protein